MINSRKKGFTLVELVIVIAVVAILAAVLIPTFSSLVKKANLSADQQAVRQMNTLLATEGVGKEIEDLEDVILILDENGYNVYALTPLSDGYYFAWNKTENQIILVKTDELGQNLNLNTGATFLNEEVSSAEHLAVALSAGADITLTSDIKLPKNQDIINISGDVVIDLKGYNITTEAKAQRPFEMAANSKLTINAEGSEFVLAKDNYGLVNIKQENVEIEINGGTFKSNMDNGAFIRVRNGANNVSITLNNVVFEDASDDSFVMNIYGCEGNINLVINGGSFTAFAGLQVKDATITGATFNTDAMTFEISGTGTIKNCTITAGSKTVSTAPAAAVAVSANGEVEVSNCTISGSCAYYVYSSGGTIKATNNVIDVTNEYEITQDNGTYPNAVSKVIINGVEKQK